VSGSYRVVIRKLWMTSGFSRQETHQGQHRGEKSDIHDYLVPVLKFAISVVGTAYSVHCYDFLLCCNV